jgi:hypothetical protein
MYLWWVIFLLPSAPVISEETARQALLDHVAEHCCWGKDAAEKLTFNELLSSTSYHVSALLRDEVYLKQLSVANTRNAHYGICLRKVSHVD